MQYSQEGEFLSSDLQLLYFWGNGGDPENFLLYYNANQK